MPSRRASTPQAEWLTTPDTPELGPGPRPGCRTVSDLNTQIEAALGPPMPVRELLRALILLWHDHHDAAHHIVQELEDRDGSMIHGMLHRREPDYSNARYWFRRAREHPCFGQLAAEATALLHAQPSSSSAWKPRLVPGGHWDPIAFIDACEEFSGDPAASERVQILRSLQAIEFRVLFDQLWLRARSL